jgi:hypothetical protein
MTGVIRLEKSLRVTGATDQHTSINYQDNDVIITSLVHHRCTSNKGNSRDFDAQY